MLFCSSCFAPKGDPKRGRPVFIQPLWRFPEDPHLTYKGKQYSPQ
ncbi:hypothetical protein CYB_2095 [Synechococcus sp. JA-2-3B'a(2-13)]|nr:hypothetical protein CYB_2095 [Synechococcus sp. JA-2-3B'a(2-13)]